MKIAVIAIGDELLLGNVVDTNTPLIASCADTEGWEIVYSCHVGDSARDIKEAIALCLGRADVVITTGGLGPTKDDVTKKVMCDFFGCGMRHDESVAANVRRIFKERGLKMNDLTASQAMVPEACTVIPNAVGTAPIMWFERDGKILVSMPGVPRETRYVFTNEVIPALRERFVSPASAHVHHAFVITEGISESAINEMLDAQPGDSPLSCVHVAYLPQSGYLKMRLDSTCESLVQRALTCLQQLLGNRVLYTGDMTPAEALINLLRERNATLSTAESCTGGNIAHLITSIPGSSDVYAGSVVSYSNAVKMNLLHVEGTTLDKYGAVSEEVVCEMARGVAGATATTYSVATSGIAGPGGATPGKSVGTVCIALHSPRGEYAETCHFPGNRAEIITRASIRALCLLIRHVETTS